MFKSLIIKTLQQGPYEIRFDTANQYNSMWTVLKSLDAKSKEVLSIDEIDYKVLIDANSVLYMYHPDEDITWEDGHMRRLSVVFADGTRLNFLIQGKKRAKNIFELFKPLVNAEPTHKFINFQQENNKHALVKHHSVIKELHYGEVKKATEVINE